MTSWGLNPGKVLGTALTLLTSLLVASCGQLNDNPGRDAEMRISLYDLQRQIGYTDSQINQAALTEFPGGATSMVKTLIIGAVVTNRTAPYGNDVILSEGLLKSLQGDIQRSSEFVQFIPLPTSQEFLEVLIPTSGGKWQVVVEGSSRQPRTVGELQNPDEQAALIYLGFSEGFINPDLTESVHITLRRNCLATYAPPKGCAQYDIDPYHTPVITAPMEIAAVLFDGTAQNPVDLGLSGLPWRIRETPADGTEITPVTAIGDLKLLLNPAADPGLGRTHPSLTTIITTHEDSEFHRAECYGFIPPALPADYETLDPNDPDNINCLQSYNTSLGVDLPLAATITLPSGDITIPEINGVDNLIDFSSSANGGHGAGSFAWNFDADNTSGGPSPITNDPNPQSVAFDSPGKYRVVLTITDEAGNTSSDEVNITVAVTPVGTEFGPAITGMQFLRSSTALSVQVDASAGSADVNSISMEIDETTYVATGYFDCSKICPYPLTASIFVPAWSTGTSGELVITPYDERFDSGEILITLTDTNGLQAQTRHMINLNDFPIKRPRKLAEELPPYDDFESGPPIDPAKWKDAEKTRRILGGELGLHLREEAGAGAINALQIADPSVALGVQATVRIDAYNDATGAAGAGISGAFYVDTAGNTIHARLMMTNTKVQYFIESCSAGVCTPTGGTGTVGNPVTQGEPHTLSLTWNGVNTFVFQKGFDPSVTVDLSSFNPFGSSTAGFREVLVSGTSATITAAFDNIGVHAGTPPFTAYDDFSATDGSINLAKWKHGELSREITDDGSGFNKVLVSSSRHTPRDESMLNIPNASVGAVAADVTVTAYEYMGGANTVAIIGTFYNDGTAGAGFVGDIMGRIEMTGTEAFYSVVRCTEENTCASFDTLVKASLGLVLLNETHTLFMQWDGARVAFQLDRNDILTVDPVALGASISSVTPNVPLRQLGAVSPVDGVGGGAVTAKIDNVVMGNALVVP